LNINRIRSSHPLRFLLAFFIWMGLEFVVWEIFKAEKFLDRYPKRKKIEQWIHLVCGLLALGLAVFILDDIERLTGLDLPD
jgi:threonine/homoserine/homoserine lactone efflux protein